MKAICNSLKLKTSLVNRDHLLKFHFLIHMAHLAVPLIQMEITPKYPEKDVSGFQLFPLLSVGISEVIFLSA